MAKLPKRYLPFLRQARTETDIRYGQPQSALDQILTQTVTTAGRSLAAAETQNQSIIGARHAGAGDVSRAYSSAGLTPDVLAGAAGNPGLQRIASELASSQAGMISQENGAIAGAAYQRQHILDQLHDDL